MNAPFFTQTAADQVQEGQVQGTGLPLVRRRTGKVLGKRMEDQLRFAVCYWHSFCLAGHRSLRRRDLHAAVACLADDDGDGAAEGGRRLRDVRSPRRAVLHLPRPRHRTRGRDARRVEQERPRDRRGLRQEDGDAEGAAALGHRQPVLQPPLHGRRRDQSRPGGLRLCRRAGEERARHDPRARRRQLRPVGRPRGLRDAAQHRHQARARPAWPLPDHGRRAQAQDRLQGHHPDRAEAEGADQAPVRFRRRLDLRHAAGLRPRGPGQDQHRAEPRDPRRPHLRARAGAGRGRRHPRLDRHQSRRLSARLGHRPVRHEHPGDGARLLLHLQGRRPRHRRLQLRRQDPPPVDRAGRSARSPCRIDGRLRPWPADRREDDRRRRPRRFRRRALRGLGQQGGQGDPRRQAVARRSVGVGV